MKHTEMIMVIEAHSEGKAIEVKRTEFPGWADIEIPSWNFSNNEYRVKSESNYITDRVYIKRKDERYKMVSINALEDALNLVAFELRETEDYKALKELLK